MTRLGCRRSRFGCPIRSTGGRIFGITEAIINVHHFADMIEQYLKSKNSFDMRIEISREDDQLLDTGGGLKEAAWFFQERGPGRAFEGLGRADAEGAHDPDDGVDPRRALCRAPAG